MVIYIFNTSISTKCYHGYVKIVTKSTHLIFFTSTNICFRCKLRKKIENSPSLHSLKFNSSSSFVATKVLFALEVWHNKINIVLQKHFHSIKAFGISITEQNWMTFSSFKNKKHKLRTWFWIFHFSQKKRASWTRLQAYWPKLWRRSKVEEQKCCSRRPFLGLLKSQGSNKGSQRKPNMVGPEVSLWNSGSPGSQAKGWSKQ